MKKTRRIHELDLAEIAPISDPFVKRKKLEGLGSGFSVKHNLNPVRRAMPDILNKQGSLPFELSPAAEETILRNVIRACRHLPDVRYNYPLAVALLHHFRGKKVQSFERTQSSWDVGRGHTVRYWNDLYSLVDGQPTFSFLNPRISLLLRESSVTFALSLMNERLREEDPDFADAELMLMQARPVSRTQRTILVHSDRDYALFPRSLLSEMIEETYAILEIIELDRAREETGTDG